MMGCSNPHPHCQVPCHLVLMSHFLPISSPFSYQLVFALVVLLRLKDLECFFFRIKTLTMWKAPFEAGIGL